MKLYLFACSVFLWVFSSSLCHAVREPAYPLFFVERSKNQNIVQYDIRPVEEGSPTVTAPVVAYWILENGETRGLSHIQREFAYGIKFQRRLEKDRYEIVLTAFKGRKITVQKTDDGYEALVLIDGQEGILERVYVESRERLFGLPRVLFVDLFGRDGRTDLPLTERIFPP